MVYSSSFCSRESSLLLWERARERENFLLPVSSPLEGED
jgi:hypothetical protein